MPPPPPPSPSQDAPRWALARFAAGLKNIGLRMHRAQLPRMAAALAYRTIFALIPMFVIGVAVIGTLADKGRVESVVDQVFELTGINRIVLDPSAEPESESSDEPAEEATDGSEAEPADVQAPDPTVDSAADPDSEEASSPEDRVRLDLWMDNLVSGVQGEQGRLKAIGAVGIAALVYAALGFLIEIERAFNSIYHARDGRAWSRRFTTYTTLLVVGPIFLILTFWLGSELGRALEWFTNWTGLELPVLAELIVHAVGVMISTLLFVLLYRVIPNARVHIGAATGGALLAAVLWELAKYGLVEYMSAFSGGVSRLYGAIGLIPIFLLWVYVTWLIVLFGLQCAFLFQHRRGVMGDDPDRLWRVVDPAAALAVAAAAARRFADGKTLSPSLAARAAGVDEDLARGLLEGLKRRGVLHCVFDDEDEEDPASFVLAEPPEKVSALTVLEAGFALTGTEGSRMLRDAQLAAVKGRTLADVAGEFADR